MSLDTINVIFILFINFPNGNTMYIVCTKYQKNNIELLRKEKIVSYKHINVVHIGSITITSL